MTTDSHEEQTIDSAGIYRGYPIEQDLKEYDESSSIAVVIKYKIIEKLVDDTWVDILQDKALPQNLWVGNLGIAVFSLFDRIALVSRG